MKARWKRENGPKRERALATGESHGDRLLFFRAAFFLQWISGNDEPLRDDDEQ